MTIMSSVSGLEDEHAEDSKLLAFKIGRKVGFEVLARLFTNTQHIKKITKTMIEVARSSPTMSAEFLKGLIEENDAEIVMEILLDCTDKVTQKQLCKIFKFMLC